MAYDVVLSCAGQLLLSIGNGAADSTGGYRRGRYGLNLATVLLHGKRRAVLALELAAELWSGKLRAKSWCLGGYKNLVRLERLSVGQEPNHENDVAAVSAGISPFRRVARNLTVR